jgi:oxygen-independent coproporphyrinogen-3 oxidase
MGRGSELAAVPAPVQGHPLTQAAAGPGLYVHVPFCRVRCPYCDFATAPYSARLAARYGHALRVDAERARPFVGSARFETVFYGGGTPSRLEPDAFLQMARGLAERLDLAHAAEVTLEANPEDVDAEHLQAWRAGGVTRLSIGVQSLDEAELRMLGRPHGRDGALTAMRRVGECFEDWSCDLIFGFPGHGLATWERTLGETVAAGAPHLSAYHFTAERGTPMGNAVQAGRVKAPDEDLSALLFERASRTLVEAGYRHYEVSNYARPGHESKHNRLYWTGRDYWGLGPGAVGTWRGVRRTNVRDTAVYVARLESGLAAVHSEEDVARAGLVERVMMGLRLEEGVSWTDLASYGEEAAAWRAAIESTADLGWLTADTEGFRLEEDRRAVTDEVCAHLWNEVEAKRGVRRPAHEARKTG